MIDLTQFKTKEQLHAFYLENPDAIEFKDYADLLLQLTKGNDDATLSGKDDTSV